VKSIPWVIFAAYAIGFLVWILRQRRSWTDDDHYDLVQKYSEAASALTAMKAELDKLQERLEFSEDVRYALGMENANLAKEIEGLNRDVEKGEEARLFLMGQLNIVINDKWRLEDRLKVAERSLRIARHKEFKRWKKRAKRQYLDGTPPASHGEKLSQEFNFFDWIFNDRIRRFLPYRDRDHASEEISYGKKRLPEIIAKLRTMDPYPLP